MKLLILERFVILEVLTQLLKDFFVNEGESTRAAWGTLLGAELRASCLGPSTLFSATALMPFYFAKQHRSVVCFLPLWKHHTSTYKRILCPALTLTFVNFRLDLIGWSTVPNPSNPSRLTLECTELPLLSWLACSHRGHCQTLHLFCSMMYPEWLLEIWCL